MSPKAGPGEGEEEVVVMEEPYGRHGGHGRIKQEVMPHNRVTGKE